LTPAPAPLFVFNRIVPMSRYHRDVPRDAWFAAKIATMLSEDCGPCTQLAVTMAEREGVNAKLLFAIVNRDTRAMTLDAALGFRFAQATLAHSPSADEYRETIKRRWGRHAAVSAAASAWRRSIRSGAPTVSSASSKG
jgi:hypothetical protein